MLRLALKAVAVILLAAVAAPAQPSPAVSGKKAQKTVARKHRKAPTKKEAPKAAPAPVIAPAPVPPAPKTPAEMPPVAPKVTFQNGLLTIDAPNSTLGDVLAAVKKATGAEIDAASASDRVIVHIGPGDPKDVLASLLSGSKFDYIILGSAENPNAVTQVILTQRSNMTESTPAPRAGFVTAQPPAETEEESPDEEQGNEQPQPRFASPPPLVRPRTMPPDQVIPPRQPVTPDATQNPNQTQTPQQLFEQLRQMEQQRAEQQKQQKPR